ncbi:MAG: hypothetical protein MR451_06880 [Clostridiales bacterium]|nr:hypothetical protein [Butyricicoccus pullicaecorum]MCI6720508.1 hypothetical protein [Clostridiales bacterium]
MFILKCPCGNELYCSNEESRTAWQCDVCGQWLDMFGFPADKPVGEAVPDDVTCMTFEGF